MKLYITIKIEVLISEFSQKSRKCKKRDYYQYLHVIYRQFHTQETFLNDNTALHSNIKMQKIKKRYQDTTIRAFCKTFKIASILFLIFLASILYAYVSVCECVYICMYVHVLIDT